MQKFPIHPSHPERICWGCDKMCPAEDMCCGNGSIRAPHPIELIGPDWYDLLQASEAAQSTGEDAGQLIHNLSGHGGL